MLGRTLTALSHAINNVAFFIDMVALCNCQMVTNSTQTMFTYFAFRENPAIINLFIMLYSIEWLDCFDAGCCSRTDNCCGTASLSWCSSWPARQGTVINFCVKLTSYYSLNFQQSGTTALFHACQHGKVDIVMVLLQASAIVDIPTVCHQEYSLFISPYIYIYIMFICTLDYWRHSTTSFMWLWKCADCSASLKKSS